MTTAFLEDVTTMCVRSLKEEEIVHTPPAQGYPEPEARELLDRECGSVLRKRRDDALALIKHAGRFLGAQVRLGVSRGGLHTCMLACQQLAVFR